VLQDVTRKKLLIIEKLIITLALWFAFLLGEWHISLTVLFIFMAIVAITSIFKAIITKEVDSSKVYKEIIKNVGVFLAIILANMLDLLTGSELLFRSMTILFFVGWIGVRIIENLGHMGVPLPKKLTQYLTQLSEEGKEKNE